MKTCKNCNTQIEDGATFCPACGTKAEQVANNSAVNPTKVHCPKCKSTSITITTESSVDSAISTNGRHVSSTSFSNTHRNFWICSDCGTKFRNIQSLEEEIEAKKNNPRSFAIMAIISAILSLLIVNSFFFTLLVITVPLTIVAICCIFSWKKKLAAMREELEYLKQNCFN